MYNRVNFWSSMFTVFLCYTGLPLGIPMANAQILPNVLNLPLKEISCSTFLQPYSDWLKASPSNHVNTTVVFNKEIANEPDSVVTYNSGNLRLNGFEFKSDLVQLSSNIFERKFTPGSPFPSIGEQPFFIGNSTSATITFDTNGRVTWTQSFDRVSHVYKAVCYSNNTAILLPSSDLQKLAGVITFKKITLPETPR